MSTLGDECFQTPSHLGSDKEGVAMRTKANQETGRNGRPASLRTKPREFLRKASLAQSRYAKTASITLLLLLVAGLLSAASASRTPRTAKTAAERRRLE